MYAESKVLEKLARFRDKYGWIPSYHSVEEVDKVTAHIQSLAEKDSNGDLVWDDSTFSSKLKRWIQNERTLCALDASYFLTRYYYISADNQIIRFTYRSGQKAFFRVIQELEEKGQSIEIQALRPASREFLRW